MFCWFPAAMGVGAQSGVSIQALHQAPVVQKADGAIHWINHYPVDSTISFRNTSAIQLLNNQGLLYKFG